MRKISDKNRIKILSLAEKHYQDSLKKSIVPGKDYIPPSGKVFNEKELINLLDASLDFWLTEGRYNVEFEDRLSKYFGLRYATTTNSGSSANLLAFYTLTSPLLGKWSIKKGDEVIEAATCFPTTLNPVIQFGCTPVLVDVSVPSYNPTLKSIKSAVTVKTKAIFLAHTLGNPYEAMELGKFCKERGIWLIEDCCDAFGSLYKGKKVGTFGDLMTLSFYPAHQITCGEGGAVLTRNAALNKILRSYRDWGRDCWCAPGDSNTCEKRFDWKLGQLPDGYDHKYIYSNIGFNMKMTDMQAAVGLAQMDKIDKFIKKRTQNHQLMRKKFLEFEKYFILPEPAIDSSPSWFGFVISIRKGAPFTRRELIEFLEKKGVGTRLLFGGNITKQPAYADVHFKIKGKLKNSDFVMNNTFWIGCYPAINKNIIEYIMQSFREFLSGR